MGPSGCGKTTLLHLIAGLLKPRSGDIIIDETNLTGLSGGQTDAFRGRHIGIVFQKPLFIPWLTAYENVQIACYLNNKDTVRSEILGLLDSLQLEGKDSSKPAELSQGELQRLSIARAMVNKPALILADEPTSSLDDVNCEKAIGILKEQAAAVGAMLLIVTHDKRLLDHFSNILFL
jgi:putative ABC transport system ATP-binding protein